MLQGEQQDDGLIGEKLFSGSGFKPPLFDNGEEERGNGTNNGQETHGSSSFQNPAQIAQDRNLSNKEISGTAENKDYSQFYLNVDISDALSERDKVKYTVHTKTNFPEFLRKEISVVREHEEFIWLHNCLEDNEDYAGFIIPPSPPKPDFEASREKLQKLGECEATLTKEEFAKLKQELEQEYLATFKKTVALHEVFLCRLAAHPLFRRDKNFHVFLEYEDNLSVRGRNTKELIGTFFKRFTQSADEVLLSGQKDIDNFFENEKNYLCEYYIHVKETAEKSDKDCHNRLNVSDCYSKVAIYFDKLAHFETVNGDKNFGKFASKVIDCFEKLKKAEARAATDQELKETDILKYFARETQAGKDLLYRRTRCLANYETANKNLERCRAKNRDINKAENDQAEACKKFEEISTQAKTELLALKKNRVESFKKNLAELADLQIKQSKNKIMILQMALKSIEELDQQYPSPTQQTGTYSIASSSNQY